MVNSVNPSVNPGNYNSGNSIPHQLLQTLHALIAEIESNCNEGRFDQHTLNECYQVQRILQEISTSDPTFRPKAIEELNIQANSALNQIQNIFAIRETLEANHLSPSQIKEYEQEKQQCESQLKMNAGSLTYLASQLPL